MKHSDVMPLIEAITNVVVGYGVAVVTQILNFSVFGLKVMLEQNFNLTGIFTLRSLFHAFDLGQTYETIHVRDGSRINDL